MAAARVAVAELERLRAEALADADHGAAEPDTELSASVVGLTERIAELGRQLTLLEEAGATARTQTLGLRRNEDRAGDGLPFQAGPLPGAPFGATGEPPPNHRA